MHSLLQELDEELDPALAVGNAGEQLRLGGEQRGDLGRGLRLDLFRRFEQFGLALRCREQDARSGGPLFDGRSVG